MALPLAWSSSIRKGDGLFNSPNSLTQKRRADRRRTPGTTREVRLLAQSCKRGWKRLAVRKRTARRFRFFTTSRPVCGANRVDSSIAEGVLDPGREVAAGLRQGQGCHQGGKTQDFSLRDRTWSRDQPAVAVVMPGIGHGLSEQLFSTRAGVLCDRSFGKQDAALTTQKGKGAVRRRSSMVSYRPNLSCDKHQAFAEEQ